MHISIAVCQGHLEGDCTKYFGKRKQAKVAVLQNLVLIKNLHTSKFCLIHDIDISHLIEMWKDLEDMSLKEED